MLCKLTIFFLIASVFSSDLEEVEDRIHVTECDLAHKADESICYLNTNITTTFISSSKYRLPIELVQNGSLIWLNKYQPAETRWSQLCPSPYLIKSTKSNNNKCLNAATCDQDSFCLIAYELNSQIKLKDNIVLPNDDGPQFTEDLKSFNVTFDLENNQHELLLIDSTNKLDLLRSKPFRSSNEFKLGPVNDTSDCQRSTDMFMLRFDQVEEKLYLKLVNLTITLKKFQCFVLNLTVKRRSAQLSSSSSVQINLIDNRLDKPVFDHLVYNFTISENSPIETLVGKVHAQYLSLKTVKPAQIKYRIVPFITNGLDSSLNQFVKSNQDDSIVPVRINPYNGSLILKLNLDREKYLDNQDKQSLNSDGILRLSIESSYASTKYSYCKVNIFIEDVNDNQPIAKLSPLNNYGIKPKQINNSFDLKETNSTIISLYINENTPVNQILAYLAVYDPDSGENGTIKSIDLTVINYKQASNQTIRERELKFQKLNKIKPLNILKPQVPFRLNKIGDKVYTVQLIAELDYKKIESYTIEMRIQDNGTHPQLESKTIFMINVIDQNDYSPVFTHENLINVSIEELNELNQKVFRVNAVDLDDGLNGEVRYKILNNPFLDLIEPKSEFEANKRLETTFDLNAQTGELRLLRPLVRDNGFDGEYLDLVIMAFDNFNALEQNYDYETDTSDTQSSHKSLNSTCIIRIKIADKNNNKPIFASNNLNLTLKRLTSKTGFKNLASVIVSDLDSFETNSKYFENETSQFIYKDESCKQSFKFEIVNYDLEKTPFIFLVELIEAKNEVKCKLSVWLNLNNDLKHLNQVDFIINVTDNGDKNSDDLSTLAIRINLNTDETDEQKTTVQEIDLRIKNQIKMLQNYNKTISVFKLNQLNQIQLDDLQNLDNPTDLNNKNGVYFIDFIQNQEQKQAKIILFSSESTRDSKIKQLKEYEQQINSLLNRQELEEKTSSLAQFEGLLFNSSILVAGTNLTALLFNNQNTTPSSQFVVLIFIVLLFIISIFTCCICLIIKRKCFKQNKKSNQSTFNSVINKHNLNVIDDDDGFKQQISNQYSVVVIQDLKQYLTDESSTKVNRYLEGLDTADLPSHSISIQANQQSSPASVMSQISKTTLPITSSESIQSNNEMNSNSNKCTLSTTSSSCISSDESGCYGSSDFSSEVNLKLKQIKNKSNLITSIQQQNFYISNLTRFEKIYNKIDFLLESPLNKDSGDSLAITSISGSYV